VSARAALLAVAASLAMAGATAWLLELSLGSLVLLAPVIVLGAAALSGLAMLWGRALVASLRGSRD
jgi:hypothetical protein